MAKTILRAGEPLDLLNADEMRDVLSDARAAEYAAIRGIKKIDLPLVSGTASSSAIAFGGKSSSSGGGSGGGTAAV